MKNVNWKEMLITHAEKGVLGLAGLIVLVGLATTSWGTYDKQPSQFEDGVSKGRSNFDKSQWPEDRKAEFEAEDPGLQVVRLFDGARTYSYSARWVLPLNKSKERIKEPNWYGFETVVADAGKILMEMLPPPEPTTVAVKSNDGTGERRIELPAGAIEGPKVEGPRVEGPRQPGATGAPSLPSETSDYDALNEQMANMDSEGSMSSNGTGVTKRGKAKGTRFAAVRAVFPLKKQVEELKRAMNLDSQGEAYQELVFWDFELERQTAVADADPWSGPWEKVDIKYALDLLSRTDFDVDVVDERFREAIFTMPLPYRVTGNWGSGPGGITNGRLLASHPRIKQVLTAEQREEQEKRNAALIAAEKASEARSKQARGGFGLIQHDTKSLARTATQHSGMMNSFQEMMMEGEDEPSEAKEGLANPYGAGGSAAYGMQGAFGLAKVTEISELLLFRFLDFSVVPGNAYRYRVKIKLQNPNFGREVSDIDPGHLVAREGEFRTTEWSEPSIPAIIQDETDFYVAKVDERRGATIDVHEWMGDTGSYVNGRFENVMPGDQIARWREEGRKGGYKKGTGIETPVLRPYEETYKDEVIDFVTPNTLVDLSETTILNPEDHPELELEGARRMNVSLEEIVMINRFGELVQTDSVSQQAAYKSAADLIASQERVWDFLREKAQAPQQSGLDGLLEGSEEGPGMSEMMSMGMGMEMGGGKRRRSSTKRSSSDMMMMMQGGF